MTSMLSAGAVALVLAAAAAPAPAAESGASYGQELAQVYGMYQSVLGHKEACNEASPNTRGAMEKSYAAWRSRNAKVIAELDERLTRMIRGASGEDDKQYARNIGKYEGAMLQQRNEAKREFLAQPREDLEALCKSLPDLLARRESDLETLYAEELKSIRGRR